MKEIGGGGGETSQYNKVGVLKQFVSYKIEGLGVKASNKSETSKCSYIIQSLQNGRIAESEIFITRGDYMCKLDQKDANY